MHECVYLCCTSCHLAGCGLFVVAYFQPATFIDCLHRVQTVHQGQAVKSGIKLWVLADAVTAYCYNLEVYTGKHGQQINRLMGLSA